MRRRYPILEFDNTLKAVLEPKRVVGPIDAPVHCVVCFFQDVIEKLCRDGQAKMIACQKSEIGSHPVYEICLNGRRLGVFHPGIGAPLASALLEEVIALGFKKFIACGGAASLDRDVAYGDIIVPAAAVRDEGTSYRYLPPGREVYASREGIAAIEAVLKEHQLDYVVSKTWTTDGVYRQTRARIRKRRSEGCLVVEMEAAAFFAVAQFRNITFAQVLYAADDVSGSEWSARNLDRMDTLRQKLFWLAAEACIVL
ncbi:MAG TPA: nucleoside phosphorylase [Blastocatellia bacterium]|nr:nucleoside phosphorylase [Blastocatellia bacterium]